MLTIGNFFDKFRNVALKEVVFRETISEIVKKNTGSGIDIKDITYSNKIIRLKTSPAMKNQIFIKKEKILEDIKATITNYIVIDLQ
jgi:hypothetical protein